MRLGETPKLYISPPFWSAGKIVVCQPYIYRTFHIPRSANHLWLVAHDRPHRDRIKVSESRKTYCVIVDGRTINVTRHVYELAAPLLANGPIYVEAWYE